MTVVVWRDERREGEKEAQRTDLRRLAPPLNPSLSEPPPQTIRAALAEDAGDAGDLTTASTIPAGTPATATFTAKAAGVVAGLGVAPPSPEELARRKRRKGAAPARAAI